MWLDKILKNDKSNKEQNNQNGQSNPEPVTKKKKRPGTFDGIRDLSKILFKERDIKIEPRNITKEDKKAAIITAIIIIGLALLLWFLPVTHQFFEDFIFLRV